MTVIASGRDDKEKPESVRDAALFDPDSVFRDYPAESIAARALAALTSPAPEPPGDGESLYARNEKKRAAPGLSKEMIKRIADRTEQAAAAKRGK